MHADFIAQEHRFDIVEDVGCTDNTGYTPVGFAIMSIGPLLIGCTCAIYTGMSGLMCPEIF
jgi:pheromone a factor receptor